MKNKESKVLNTSITGNTLVMPMQLSVKHVDDRIFREFKASSVMKGFTVGKALTLAMQLWLEKHRRKPRRSLLEIKPTNWGKGTERTSEEIDKILYENGNNY